MHYIDEPEKKRTIKQFKSAMWELNQILKYLEEEEDYELRHIESSFRWAKNRLNAIELPRLKVK